MIPRIILDTDIGSDCDDAGALAVLHALADAGEAEIAACIYSSEVNPHGAGCIAAINAWYGRDGVPIGAARPGDVGDPRNDFLEKIATNRALYGHRIVTRDDAEDLLTVYRHTLANAPDRSVRIVSIGHTKGLHDLLVSEGDAWSPLRGTELVRQKVSVWVAMGGQFPKEKEPGWNFGKNGAARYSRAVIEQWPTPIVFHGYEIGCHITTGHSLLETAEENPVREAYRLWNNALENGRPSWDQAAVLHAVQGAGDYWNVEQGYCTADDAGRTTWRADGNGPHARAVQKTPPEQLTEIIGELMARKPLART